MTKDVNGGALSIGTGRFPEADEAGARSMAHSNCVQTGFPGVAGSWGRRLARSTDQLLTDPRVVGASSRQTAPLDLRCACSRQTVPLDLRHRKAERPVTCRSYSGEGVGDAAGTSSGSVPELCTLCSPPSTVDDVTIAHGAVPSISSY